MLMVDVYKIPVSWSLAFTFIVLASTMVLSLMFPAKGEVVNAFPFSPKRAPEDEVER